MKQFSRKWSMLFLVLAAMVFILGPGMARAASKLDNDADSNSSPNAKNVISSVNYELTSDGKVQVKVYLNGAYAGMGRSKWTIYAIEVIGDKTNVVKESFADAGPSTVSTPYVMKHTFTQGTAAFLGAYTDITEKNSWQSTDGESEMITNGMGVVIPSVPTDPKSSAREYTSTDDAKTYTISEKVNGKLYIKLIAAKDTYLKIDDLSIPSDYTQYMMLGNVEETDDRYHDSVRKGNEFYLAKGSYYLYSKSDGAAINLKFTMRHHVHIQDILWKADGKEVDGAVPVNKGASVTITATIQPANADAKVTATGLTNTNRGYGQIFDESVSSDGKTLTFKYLCNDDSGTDTIKMTAYSIGYKNEGMKDFQLALGVKPSAPYFTESMISATYNTIQLNTSNQFNSRVYVRADIKSGKKWKKKLDEKALKDGNTSTLHTIKGLKQNTSYTVRVKYYTKNGKKTISSSYTTFKIQTGTKTKPVVKSVKVSNVQSKKTWVDGHWVNGTVYDVWKPGHYDYYYAFKVTVTLSKAAPKGVTGLMMTNTGVTSGNASSYVKAKGNRKTFTFSCTSSSKTLNATFKFYTGSTYKGFSPLSKAKKINVN